MDFDLALVLTAAGATLSAALIAAVVQILKRVPQFGAWLNADREPAFVLLLSAALVVYAAIATIPVWVATTPFMVLLAWVGVAGLASKVYDLAPQPLKTALGGGS